ncbi:hypothetical protein [Vibrio campbellii]|uniref:hypothetical protein n=1 Tax=Vibrio campbellii TaxID=680 RepID=UPI000CD37402|nr:hypothetical protein [Vibrio campbellii]AUW06006.1 hypothetical protein C1N51_20255 [Vibrio campbellii]
MLQRKSSSNVAIDSQKRSVFNETSFILLVLATIANGLASDFVVWSKDAGHFPLSPLVVFTLFVFVYLHQKNQNHTAALGIPMAVLALFMMIPSSLASWVGLLLASLLYRIQTDRFHQSLILLIMLALTFIWQNSIFKVVSGFILHAETWLIGAFLAPFYPEMTVYTNHLLFYNGHDLSINVGCSVFSNCSFVLLGWVSMYFLLGNRSLPIKWLAILFILLTLTNVVRIGVMAIDYPTYVFVHEGLGADIYNTILILLSVTPLLFSFCKKEKKACD